MTSPPRLHGRKPKSGTRAKLEIAARFLGSSICAQSVSQPVNNIDEVGTGSVRPRKSGTGRRTPCPGQPRVSITMMPRGQGLGCWRWTLHSEISTYTSSFADTASCIPWRGLGTFCLHTSRPSGHGARKMSPVFQQGKFPKSPISCQVQSCAGKAYKRTLWEGWCERAPQSPSGGAHPFLKADSGHSDPHRAPPEE